jgi:gluconolactonase
MSRPIPMYFVFSAPSAKLLIAASCVLLGTSPNLLAQRGGGGFPQPEPAREVTVSAIPGVVGAGAKWTLSWGGADNADGLIGTKDGSLLFAQEQPNRISKLDKKDKFSSFLENSHGVGALAMDAKGHLFAVQRTCTDPGRRAVDPCTEATGVAQLTPQRKVLADNVDGKSLGRVNDLVVAKNGGVYFNGTGTYYMNPQGKVISIGENIRTNGIMLSRDEKTLYVTNGGELVAFDVQADGTVKNQRSFAKLEGGGTGDGLAIDKEGRIYVTSQPGVQVISAEGKYLGIIPTPRPVISAAFAGPGKKDLYVVGAGAVGPDGKELRTPDGVRNNAKSIFKITTLTSGFSGRAK